MHPAPSSHPLSEASRKEGRGEGRRNRRRVGLVGCLKPSAELGTTTLMSAPRFQKEEPRNAESGEEGREETDDQGEFS